MGPEGWVAGTAIRVGVVITGGNIGVEELQGIAPGLQLSTRSG